jgi:predicted AlkP superfamily phosphohydrolase/phosphomutase
MDAGHLPNLKRLTELGARGQLESTRPPTTAPAWMACVTGTNPGQHGVFDFRESPFLDPRRPLVSSRSVQVPTLWQILSYHGRQVGLLNVPISYPPEPVNGFVVSGMMSPGSESNYTYPPHLRDELNAQGYVIDVEIQRYDVEAQDDALRFLDDVEAALRKRVEALFGLMDSWPWQFLMAVFVAADRIQHLMWKTMADPESRFYHAPEAPRLRERILTIYQLMDEVVGRLVAHVVDDGQADLFIVSDHGFGSTKAWINVNRWLREQGWLCLKPLATVRKRLFYEAMKVNDSPFIKRLLPESVGRTVRGRVRRGRSVFKTDLDQCVDWTRTRAFFASIPVQGIYINVRRGNIGTVEPGVEYRTLRQEIRDGLLALSDPDSGERIVDQVWFREELYQGRQTHLAPDVLFVARDYGYLGRELLGTRGPVETSMNWANGFHRMNGILMAYGPHIRRGAWVEGARIIDVAPTVLYDLGLPVPANMDGRVLTDMLDPAHVRVNPVRQDAPLMRTEGPMDAGHTEDEQSQVASRLAGLGYIE